MKIVKLEDFHVDGGWDTYSFLKITTDEGITGWSEFNESRRKGHDRRGPGPRRRAHRPGPARSRSHRCDPVRPIAPTAGGSRLTPSLRS
jgi:hypothetical protein